MGLKIGLYCFLCFSQIFAKLPTLYVHSGASSQWTCIFVCQAIRTRVGKTRRGTASLCPCTFLGCRFLHIPRHLQNASIPVLQERATPIPVRTSWALFNGRTKTILWASKTKREGTALLFPPLQINMYSTYSAYGPPRRSRVSPVNITFVAC